MLSDTVRARVVFGVAHGSFLRMRLAYIALVSVALLSAACSTTVDGSAVKESGAAPGPTVDVSKLDVGPYPTQPSQPLGVTGDPLRGVLVEAQRMANNVVGPWEVDSDLDRLVRIRRHRVAERRRTGADRPGAVRGRREPARLHQWLRVGADRGGSEDSAQCGAALRRPGRRSCCRRRLRRHRGQDRRGRAARPDPRSSRRAGGELHTDRGLHRQAVERGPRLHGPRPVRVHATRAGCRWDGPGRRSGRQNH